MIPRFGCLLLLAVVSMITLCQANDTCYERTDILFVMDASGSVGSDNFQKQLQFAATFVSNFVIGQARFSVIRFSSTASVIFDFNAYNNITALQNAILSIAYTAGGTDTAAALGLARTAGFSSTSGARPGVPKIVVVCTDGQSNTPSDTVVEANNLKNSNVLVLSIGVGSSVNQAELETIASFPEDVFVVIDYNKLVAIVYDYSQLVCAAVKLFKCNNQADVYFLLDTSNNIGQDAYQKELQYVGEFSNNFNLKDVSIGAATFGGSTARGAFRLGQITTPNQLAQGLSSAVKLGGVTDTDSALRFVTAQRMFDANSGGRDNATKIVIIVTEGNSRTASQAQTTAAQLRSSGVNIIAVGVSTPNIAELKTLVGHDELDVVGSLSMPKVLVDRVLTLTALRECNLPIVSVNKTKTCSKGFELDPNDQSTCRDINECIKYTLCQHTCVNLNGSHRCECKAGFVINTEDTSKCDGTRIVIWATPPSISEGTSKTLTVRCALNDDGNSQKRVSRVNTIIIRRAEGSIQREVARIEYGQSAAAGSWATGANVTGDLSKNVGFLQASWSRPGHLQAGSYSCEIVALETDRTVITLKSNIQVDSTSQSGESLAESIAQSKDAIDALKTAVGACQRETDELKKTVGAGQRETDELKKTVGAGQRETDELKKMVNDLKTNIGGLSSVHNEEGFIKCTNSVSWGETLKPRDQVKEVRFSTPYARNPLVIISTVSLDVDKLYNLRYWIGITDLTPTGFKVICHTWWDTVLFEIGVRWTSTVA